ncbi:MAG: restriction endonuclease subunit S [Oxalobacteraceae bacterium]|nr:MAG: restriction endonuclease subunit S [Oxalobacteraceae bacterium]
MFDPQTRKLSHYFTHSRRKGLPGLPLASVTMHNGLVPRADLERDKERKTKTSLSADDHSLAEPGDIAYNMMRMWQGAFGLAFTPVNVSPAYVVMRAKPTLDPRFAAQWLKSDRALYLLWAYSYGLTDDRLRLYPKEFLQIPVVWPDRAEQRRIAALLESWDEAIRLAQKLVEAKSERYDWLADHLAFRSNEWLTIDDVAEQVSERAGSSFKRFDVFSCTKHDGLVLSDEYFSKTVYGSDRTDYKVVQPLNLAYATNHLEEGSIGLNTFNAPGIVSPMYTVFRATGINPRYLIAILKTERLRREFERRTPASVNRRGGLRWGDFAEIEIPCPDAEEQDYVLKVLDCAKADLKAAEDNLALLRTQKRGLMQQLLTTQLPVPESIDALMSEVSGVSP